MIQGEAIILRPVEQTDLERLVAWRNDPSISKYFFNVFPLSMAGQRNWFEDLLEREDKRLFIIDTTEKVPVGTVGLDNIDFKNQRAEFGSLLIQPSHQGKGLALDATKSLLKFAFDDLNLNRICLQVFDWNKPAIQLYLRCGFQEEGLLRQSVYKDGGFQDVLLMAILREEFNSNAYRSVI